SIVNNICFFQQIHNAHAKAPSLYPTLFSGSHRTITDVNGQHNLSNVVRFKNRNRQIATSAENSFQNHRSTHLPGPGPNSTRYKFRQSSSYSVKTTRSMMRRRMAETNRQFEKNVSGVAHGRWN